MCSKTLYWPHDSVLVALLTTNSALFMWVITHLLIPLAVADLRAGLYVPQSKPRHGGAQQHLPAWCGGLLDPIDFTGYMQTSAFPTHRCFYS